MGDPSMTVDEKQTVDDERTDWIHFKEQQWREKDLNRFWLQTDVERCAIENDLKLDAKPNWDIYKNNHFALWKWCIDIFLKSMTWLIIK